MEKNLFLEKQSAHSLGKLYKECTDINSCLPTWFSMLAMNDVIARTSASWLIKKSIENQQSLTSHQLDQWFECLMDQQEIAEVHLHILQTFQYLDLGTIKKKQIVETLDAFTHHKSTFIRTWALDALYRLSLTYPELETLFERKAYDAIQNEKPAVIARLRQLKKV